VTGQEFPAEEVRAAVEQYVDVRERIEAGEAGWSEFVDLFTDDAVFVDPAWGRVEGKDGIRHLFATAMLGVEFAFPIDFTAIAGSWVVVKWRQVLPRRRPDGQLWQQSGVSTLLYGGGGLFRYEEDLLNLAHVMEDIVESGWEPGPGFTPPPERPDRNFDPEPARRPA
jgi:ketosteroid isomerase-like protein